jgi:hypothetical protein
VVVAYIKAVALLAMAGQAVAAQELHLELPLHLDRLIQVVVVVLVVMDQILVAVVQAVPVLSSSRFKTLLALNSPVV